MMETVAYAFDLDGGRPCLDFANTLSSSSGEHLASYADLVDFAEQSALITPHTAERLHDRARRDVAGVDEVMQRAYALRAAVYAIFSALAANAIPSESDVQTLNAELARSMAHAQVVAANDGYQWGWTEPQLDTPLWGITRSAADVLTSDQDRARVRECGGDECRWLFIDTSKNRSRQWCSMQSCGNRQKARRHYLRIRSASRTASAANTGKAS
jgi:predicted RNA-binding Zn ribbon-like protein